MFCFKHPRMGLPRCFCSPVYFGNETCYSYYEDKFVQTEKGQVCDKSKRAPRG